MAKRELANEELEVLDQVLGYLNFSAGSPDPQFLANLNQLFDLADSAGCTEGGAATWQRVIQALEGRLRELAGGSSPFGDTKQVASVLDLVANYVLPEYMSYHRDLLFRQTPDDLFNAFFVGRAAEAVLKQGGPWHEFDRITEDAIGALNDYLGYRPIGTLESHRVEAYAHEWVRPVPLYVRGAGSLHGPYNEVVKQAIRLLSETDPSIQRAAQFDPDVLEELAIDPRGYDFDHPVNKRPNYHFGQWDPHQIDGQGRYTRFVIQQVTLNALMNRLESEVDLPREEAILEAAAVLAGVVLMASGISGYGPGAYDSTVTFANLLPVIARYRDAFYEQLLDRIEGPHKQRLEKEMSERRQPFGGARQHLNAQLARQRASELAHAHLSYLFARMGYPKSAMKQASLIPVASVRMHCRIDCRITVGHKSMDRGELEHALNLLPEIIDLVERGIECGALIDPWNILAFDARFSLFPSPENSVHDHRADELVGLVERIFAFAARLWSEAAAIDDNDICDRVRQTLDSLTTWWRKYAVHEVEAVEAVDAQQAFDAAEHVAKSLNLWHRGGAATADVGFWAQHATMFDSPRAYAAVIRALLQHGDRVAAMALLIHWVGQAERVGLEQGEDSFHELALVWLSNVFQQRHEDEGETPVSDAWNEFRRLFDYIEANADTYWDVPNFELGETTKRPNGSGDLTATASDDEGEVGEFDEEDIFRAAYENVVYRDSTDDGIQGSIFDTDSDSATDDEFERESRRITHRLTFLRTIAALWKQGAVVPMDASECADEDATKQRCETLQRWVSQAISNCSGLMRLLSEVEQSHIPIPRGSHDSMVDFDRRRMMKESLLEQIISCVVDTGSSARLLGAALLRCGREEDVLKQFVDASIDVCTQQELLGVTTAVLASDCDAVRQQLSPLLDALADSPLLYVPLARGGDPRKIIDAKIRQQAIRDLLTWLPRLGLLTETRQLLETAREMERRNVVGAGAVTEFDDLFQVGFKSCVECLIASNRQWECTEGDDTEQRPPLVAHLEQLAEGLLLTWLKHSRTLRLSVLEKVKRDRYWQPLVEFIKQYGKDLFTQRFLNLANLRGILHQGAENWLRQLADDDFPEEEYRLAEDYRRGETPEHVVENLTLVLEAIVENYGEYRDYNSTTTQSDHGELLYTFLDFLRLRTHYDRVAWNLKPVIWVHEVLVRQGMEDDAAHWRESLTTRIQEQAEHYEDKLKKLQKTHAMRMPTIVDRIAEHFRLGFRTYWHCTIWKA